MKEIKARDRFDYTGSFSKDDEDSEEEATPRMRKVSMKGIRGKTLLPDGIYLWCTECEELHDPEANYELHFWKWIPIPKNGGEIKL